MSLPEYYFLSETALRGRAKDPKKFEEQLAQLETTSKEWDADGGYAKMIQEARASAADGDGDETSAETIFLERLSHMVASRYLQDKQEREREEEVQEQERREIESAVEEAERRRMEKGKAPMPVPAAEEGRQRKRKEKEVGVAPWEIESAVEEAERRRKEKGKAPMPMPAPAMEGRQRKRKEKERKEVGAAPKAGRIDFAAIGLDPPPRGFADVIRQQNDGARDVKLVIMKPLFNTDLNTNHNRLSMPWKQVTDTDFLTPEEFRYLDRTPPPGIPVTVIGPTNDVAIDMMLKKWMINKSDSYVLNKTWMLLVRRFPKVLKENAIIQVWTFRMPNGKRRFQIHPIAPPAGQRASSKPEFESGSGSGSGSGNSDNHDASPKPEFESGSGSGSGSGDIGNRDGDSSSGDGDVSGSSSDDKSNGSETETDERDMSPPTVRRRLMPPPM